MLRSIDEVGQHRANFPREDLEALIDDYYDSLGLRTVSSDWILRALSDAGIREGEEMTFIIPRQLPTDTVEQIGFSVIGENLGEHLLEQGEISSFEVVGAQLTDKMYGRNAEKRGYAFPAIVAEDGIYGTKAADINDGYSIGSHETRVNGDFEEIDRLLGMDPSREFLRDLHDSRDSGIVQGRGDFAQIQREIISEMVAHDVMPEIVGAEYDDGKLIALQYDSDSREYRSMEEDRAMSMSPEEVSESGILLPEDNYEKLIFPIALHPDVGYLLKGLENGKFRTQRTDQLVREVEEAGGDFPFLDASAIGKYHEEIPDSVFDRLENTRYGSSSSLEEESMVLNSYPSVATREQLDAQELKENSFEDMMKNSLEEVYRL